MTIYQKAGAIYLLGTSSLSAGCIIKHGNGSGCIATGVCLLLLSVVMLLIHAIRNDKW